MTCKQCKHITVCMVQADGLGQVFDPNYDGEHGCTDFVPHTNADRIRFMTDDEMRNKSKPRTRLHGVRSINDAATG